MQLNYYVFKKARLPADIETDTITNIPFIVSSEQTDTITNIPFIVSSDSGSIQTDTITNIPFIISGKNL